MSSFFTYLLLGFDHISDIKGFDHILFILTLCAIYTPTDWKRVAVLVTAFTLGHSITLALAALKVIVANAYWVELLIPLTIFATSISNLFYRPTDKKFSFVSHHYLMALVFGFVHGLGFSNFFNALMGDSMNIVLPLLAFNLGLEIGQLLIVVVFFGFYFFIQSLFKKVEHRGWTLFFSGAGAGVSFVLILERL